jgi:hypothetical protein
LVGTNALAYWASSSVKGKEKFMTLTPDVSFCLAFLNSHSFVSLF